MLGLVRPLAALLVAASVVVGCAVADRDTAPSDPTGTTAPTDLAPSASPPAPSSPSPTAGADGSPEAPEAVRAALAEVEEGSTPLTSLAVMHAGRSLGEAYGPGLDARTPQPVWSVTKSVVSALVGVAVDDGLLTVDTPLTTLLGDVASAHPDLTVEHLLTMRSGLDIGDSDGGFRQLDGADDWVAAVLGEPQAAPPGERFRYCSACVHLLTAVLDELTGDVAAFADARLFAPLELGEVAWDRASDGSGLPIGGWGLQLSAWQLARLGQLFLDGGVWQGEQVVPAAWVETSTTAHVELGEDFAGWQVAYGYLWWVHDNGAYAATGRGGQLVVVVPGSDLVVATTADLSDAEAYRAFAFVWTRIVAAIPLA